MTPANGVNPYLRTKVMTAGPAELRLMLFDGAIKFANQGRAAIDAGQAESAYQHLTRAKKIVLELTDGLNHKANPDICEKLTAICTYIHRLLVDANVNRDQTKVEEALDLLRYERQTWQMLIDQAADPAQSPHATPSAPATAKSPNPNPIPIHPGSPQSTQATTTYARSA